MILNAVVTGVMKPRGSYRVAEILKIDLLDSVVLFAFSKNLSNRNTNSSVFLSHYKPRTFVACRLSWGNCISLYVTSSFSGAEITLFESKYICSVGLLVIHLRS